MESNVATQSGLWCPFLKKKLLFKKKKIKEKKTNKKPTKTKTSLLPTKNTTQENCKQNINDAQIWPRVVLPDFKGMTCTLFRRSKYLSVIYQRTILDQKDGVMIEQKAQKREAWTERIREAGWDVASQQTVYAKGDMGLCV